MPEPVPLAAKVRRPARAEGHGEAAATLRRPRPPQRPERSPPLLLSERVRAPRPLAAKVRRPARGAGPAGYSVTELPSLLLPSLKCADQLGHHLEDVAHHAEVGDLEDRRVPILVDGDDRLRGLHAGPVLNRAGNAQRDIQLC
jgi:hypothetical protein